MQGREFDDPMKVRPIREAVQFELNSYHFYRLALQRSTDRTLRAVLEQLHQHEVDHLHNLQEIYHTHLDEDVLTLRPDAEGLLADALFAGLELAAEEEEHVALLESEREQFVAR